MSKYFPSKNIIYLIFLHNLLFLLIENLNVRLNQGLLRKLTLSVFQRDGSYSVENSFYQNIIKPIFLFICNDLTDFLKFYQFDQKTIASNYFIKNAKTIFVANLLSQ